MSKLSVKPSPERKPRTRKAKSIPLSRPGKGKSTGRLKREKKVKLVKTAAEPVQFAVMTPDAPKEGTKSGAYIRDLLEQECYTVSEILDAVHANYPDSKAVRSDVSFNMNLLRKDGRKVRTLRQLKDGTRKLLDFAPRKGK